jgi:hypothetical protein
MMQGKEGPNTGLVTMAVFWGFIGKVMCWLVINYKNVGKVHEGRNEHMYELS